MGRPEIPPGWEVVRLGGVLCAFDPEIGYIPETGVPWPNQPPEEPQDDDPEPFRCDGDVDFWLSNPKRTRDEYKTIRFRGDVRGVSPQHAAYYRRQTDKHWRDIQTGKLTVEPKTQR